MAHKHAIFVRADKDGMFVRHQKLGLLTYSACYLAMFYGPRYYDCYLLLLHLYPTLPAGSSKQLRMTECSGHISNQSFC